MHLIDRRGIGVTALTFLVAVAAMPTPSAGRIAAARHPAPRLENAAPSIDVLVARLLDALEARDREALRKLRVSEREYVQTIMRGHVQPGEPLRNWPANVSSYFWNVLNDKSRVFEENLLEEFGGRRYRLTALSWAEGTRQFATYTGYKQLRLELEASDGTPAHLATGSVAEVNGRFKFVSFIRD